MGKDAVAALVALGFASFAIGTDVVGVAVVMVAIEREFDTSISTTQWVISIFALTFAMAIVAGGRLADMFGRRRLFFVGVAIFGASALGCALAPDVSWLIVARAVQGIGAAIIWPCIMGLCVAAVPKEDSGFAIGLILGAAGLGNILGPIAAGVLNDLSTWRWFFVLNVATVVLSAILATRWIAADVPGDLKERIDLPGIAVLSGAIFALLYALDQGSAWSWTSPAIIGLLVVSAIFFVVFPILENRVAQPLVPPQLMRNRTFMIALAENALLIPGCFVTFIYIPQYAHKVLGWGVLSASFAGVPMWIVWASLNPIAGRFYKVLGPKRLILGGYCTLLVAIIILAMTEPSAGYAPIAVGLALLGFGAGCIVGPAGTAAVNLVDPSRASLAGGLSFMVHLAMAAIGIAAATAIVVAVSDSKLADGLKAAGLELSSAQLADVSGVLVGTESAARALSGLGSAEAAQIHALVANAFAAGFHMALWFCAGVALIGAVAALFLPRDIESADA